MLNFVYFWISDKWGCGMFISFLSPPIVFWVVPLLEYSYWPSQLCTVVLFDCVTLCGPQAAAMPRPLQMLPTWTVGLTQLSLSTCPKASLGHNISLGVKTSTHEYVRVQSELTQSPQCCPVRAVNSHSHQPQISIPCIHLCELGTAKGFEFFQFGKLK